MGSWRARSGLGPPAVLLACAVACAHAEPPAAGDAGGDALPILAATPGELARRIDALAAIATLRGRLALSFEERAGAATRACSAVLAARRPGPAVEAPGLYLQGYRALAPALFELVSDGRRFWLHVPRDDVVYTGPVARRGSVDVRGVRLDARDLFRALFLAPVAEAGALEIAEEPSAYVVTIRREGRPERRLWIERRRLTVAREAFYGRDGREEVSIERDRWADTGGHPYPAWLRVRDAATGAALTLEFRELEVNPADLRAGAFSPRTPAGARVIAVGGEEDAT